MSVATSNGGTGLESTLVGFPPSNGDLLLQTNGGWDDLGHTEAAGPTPSSPGDGVVVADPVLAVADSQDGTHAWAVGGFSGSDLPDGVGSAQPQLSARPQGWFTSAIWRYDAAGTKQPPSVSDTLVGAPPTANPGIVSFAFLSSALCREQCASAQNAQPDVNLESAATEISQFAQQPNGPAFAMLGGDEVGPSSESFWQAGNGEADLARLPSLLAPLSGVPAFAAYGPLDAVPTKTNEALPWASAFADAPSPFGSGAAPASITPISSGDATGPVHKYYSFDVAENGATLCVIVLDNSAGSLESSAAGQTAWLTSQLAQAQSAATPIVVFAARPLDVRDNGGAIDGDAVAAQLAAAGVLAVFTTSGDQPDTDSPTQTDQVVQVPIDAGGGGQIPEYEGATMTYQQPKNNGVLWYDVTVDTNADTLSVQGVPVISSLAIDPIDGLTVTRSGTLSFAGIGRRPTATIATTSGDNDAFPGFDQYVEIPPTTSCSACVTPSYTWTSSTPGVGIFVVPSSAGSPYPKLNSSGQTTASSTSGLFCAFNKGTTTITLTSGLMSASVNVTVTAGPIGAPCGSVYVPGQGQTVTVSGGQQVVTQVPPNTGTPNLGATKAAVVTSLPPVVLVPPLPTAVTPVPIPTPVVRVPPAAVPAPPVIATAPIVPIVEAPVVAVPPIPPAVTPVPPGGATASAQATAKREEKARRHASQSAYVVRPGDTDASDWFYGVVGVMSVVSIALVSGGLRPGPKQRYAYVEIHADGVRRSRR